MTKSPTLKYALFLLIFSENKKHSTVPLSNRHDSSLTKVWHTAQKPTVTHFLPEASTSCHHCGEQASGPSSEIVSMFLISVDQCATLAPSLPVLIFGRKMLEAWNVPCEQRQHSRATFTLKCYYCWVSVAHTCNPSYLGG
jgi:hypothetical protein